MCGPHVCEGWSRKFLNHLKILCVVWLAVFFTHIFLCTHGLTHLALTRLWEVHSRLIYLSFYFREFGLIYSTPPSRLTYTSSSTLQLVSEQVLTQWGPPILRDPLLEKALWLRGIPLIDLHSLMAQDIPTRRTEWKSSSKPKTTMFGGLFARVL